MSAERRQWTVWVLATLATVPASAFLWFVGGMAAGGGETYDPPPPVFVDPGIRGGWELIAASPTLLALVVGFVAIRRRSSRLFVFALSAPFVLALLGVFSILAID